jgi:ubiquinone/menaquinone biosynthesis C-methylase UbiE
MGDAISDRVGRYILDGSDEDLRRLLSISQITADVARAALDRVRVERGWRVIDCGCGPVGGLAVMADAVGPCGRVTGVDFNPSSIERARAVIDELGLDNVDAVVGDVNAPDIAVLVGDGFDLAFTRCFLMHQAEPVQTLTGIARLLRPGGWIVAQEPLRTPPPRSHPDLDAITTYWELMHDVVERAGAQHLAVEGLPASARAAGLEVVHKGGFFVNEEPELAFELHAGTLAATKARAVELGVATASDVDEVVDRIRAAKHGGYEWATSPVFLDLALRKPTGAPGDDGARS